MFSPPHRTLACFRRRPVSAAEPFPGGVLHSTAGIRPRREWRMQERSSTPTAPRLTPLGAPAPPIPPVPRRRQRASQHPLHSNLHTPHLPVIRDIPFRLLPDSVCRHTRTERARWAEAWPKPCKAPDPRDHTGAMAALWAHSSTFPASGLHPGAAVAHLHLHPAWAHGRLVLRPPSRPPAIARLQGREKPAGGGSDGVASRRCGFWGTGAGGSTAGLWHVPAGPAPTARGGTHMPWALNDLGTQHTSWDIMYCVPFIDLPWPR